VIDLTIEGMAVDILRNLLTIKKFDDGQYEVDVGPARRNGNALAGNLRKKATLLLPKKILSTTTTTKNSWRNRQITGISQS